MLDFHKQVGNMVTHVTDQYKELFGARCKPSGDYSQEQMKVQLMGTLSVSARYFAFKEQMKVRTTAHIPGRWIKLAGILIFWRRSTALIFVLVVALLFPSDFINTVLCVCVCVYVSGV